MEKLKQDLDNLNTSIREMEKRIRDAKAQAEDKVKPLSIELAQVKKDKRDYAFKNDLESVQTCRRKENNLKFKIDAQWNEYFLLTDELYKLNTEKIILESQVKLEEDKIKRNNEIRAQMDEVLKNYRKTQNLKEAAVKSNISPGHAEQWLEWGKNDFNETYSYFYVQITEIDNYFKDLEVQELKMQMDSVIEAYRKTNSLKEASQIADVSYDTVLYWYGWGKRNFGRENAYFFKSIKSLD